MEGDEVAEALVDAFGRSVEEAREAPSRERKSR